MTTKTNPLSGCGVLITRPSPQGQLLGEIIEEQGGTAFVLPLLQIELSSQTLDDFLGSDWANEVEICIFVSRYAVEGVCQGSGVQFLQQRKIAAMGAATAERLEEVDVAVDYLPVDSIDSEGMLASLKNIDLTGKRVVIFRGQSGREVLADELAARGAEVRQVSVYQRVWSTESMQPILGQWLCFGSRIMTATSGELVMQLMQRVRDADQIKVLESDVVVLSERVAGICLDMGFSGNIKVIADTNNRAILQGMVDILNSESI